MKEQKIVKVDMRTIWPRTDGKEFENNSPVLDYCRKLIKEGASEKTRLEVYRGDMLAVIIPEIGKGAKYSIRETWKIGPFFKKYSAFPQELMKKAS